MNETTDNQVEVFRRTSKCVLTQVVSTEQMMASLYRKPVILKDPQTGVKVKTISGKWWGRFRTASGVETRVPLARDKASAQAMLNELVRRVERERAGIHDPHEIHRNKLLTDHLYDFGTYLKSKADTSQHVKLTLARCRRIIQGTEAVFFTNLDLGRVSEYLVSLRASKQLQRLSAKQLDFTPSEVAKLLGISPQAVRASVQRHGLQATGQGKARRFPRATVERLLDQRAQGLGPETINHHVRAIRSFCRWMVLSKRMPTNPLDGLTLVTNTTDRRHDRRELTGGEIQALLEATRASSRVFRGLAGVDRYHLYACACGTGFRASALAGLVPEDFDLDNGMPSILLPARLAKNRKVKVQPLPSDVAELLKAYLLEKPSGGPVWLGTWAVDGAEMLRGDLAEAGIPYVVDGPDGPLFADFHSLRHSYITALGRAGVDLRTCQELAGHSSPVLTARYSHRRLHDLAGAVERLPIFHSPTCNTPVGVVSA